MLLIMHKNGFVKIWSVMINEKERKYIVNFFAVADNRIFLIYILNILLSVFLQIPARSQ